MDDLTICSKKCIFENISHMYVWYTNVNLKPILAYERPYVKLKYIRLYVGNISELQYCTNIIIKSSTLHDIEVQTMICGLISSFDTDGYYILTPNQDFYISILDKVAITFYNDNQKIYPKCDWEIYFSKSETISQESSQDIASQYIAFNCPNNYIIMISGAIIGYIIYRKYRKYLL